MNGAAINDEGPAVGAAGLLETSEIEHHDCAHEDADRKAFCTLAARLALKGFSVFELSDGSFIVSKWNLTRPLADLHAVAIFARQIGCAA